MKNYSERAYERTKKVGHRSQEDLKAGVLVHRIW